MVQVASSSSGGGGGGEGVGAEGGGGGGGGGGGSGGSGGGGGGGGGAPRREKKVAADSVSARPPKRRCVSNACIACRRRKSKVCARPMPDARLTHIHARSPPPSPLPARSPLTPPLQCDGNTPACAACASVYHTDCVYDPNSDHRRKGVYKADIDSLKNQNSTLQTLIEAILNYPEDRALDLVRQIRACDSLEDLAESIVAEGLGAGDGEGDSPESQAAFDVLSFSAAAAVAATAAGHTPDEPPQTLEAELSAKLGQLRVEDGRVCFIGATSNLMFVPTTREDHAASADTDAATPAPAPADAALDFPTTSAVATWTTVTDDPALVDHLVNMYFAWHYPYFTTLSKHLFYTQFVRGAPATATAAAAAAGPVYCTPLLVNAMLALGCHFTSASGSRARPNDPSTAGDHFFKEAKRLILENDEHESPRLTTVQALALMSVREAGCGREAKGWVYSGMSFRMAMDLGLHLDPGSLTEGIGGAGISDEEVDARRVTFWGCYLFDK